MFGKTVLVVVLDAVLTLPLGWCFGSGPVEVYYPSYEHLSEYEPGNWLPAFLPRSAVEIRGRVQIDTSQEMATFYFLERKDLSLAGFCEEVTATDAELPSSGMLAGFPWSRLSRLTWWPDSLFRNRTKEGELDRYEMYRCEQQTFLAVVQVEGRFQAFYWRVRHP